MGDFNFYRSLEKRNRAGGNYQDILLFNSSISHLGLIELPLKGRSYTWSNKQENPLLQQLDYFFTTPWSLQYPNTTVLPVAKPILDHTPCQV